MRRACAIEVDRRRAHWNQWAWFDAGRNHLYQRGPMTFGSVYIAGHRGLVGSALLRNLQKHAYRNIIVRTRDELDLRNAGDVRQFFSTTRPDAVVVAAARVGGIKANYDFPVEFLLENLQIQNNLISAGFDFGVKKLLFLGSSCSYPKLAAQPIKEEALLAGHLDRLQKLGWKSRISLEDGIRDTYQWFLRHGGRDVG